MKVTKFPKPLSKKYLRLAAVYRRYAGRKSGFDFSMQALIDCFQFESNGVKAKKNNGYVFGKWAKDISVATWREDIVAGHFCKAEFYTPLDRWWTEPALESLVVPLWFPFNKETYITKKLPNPTEKDIWANCLEATEWLPKPEEDSQPLRSPQSLQLLHKARQ